TTFVLRFAVSHRKQDESRVLGQPGNPAWKRMLCCDLRDEWQVTERLRKAVRIPAGSPVVLGIGDDCAVYRPRGSADDLLFTCDLFAEGVHFLRESLKPAEAGRRALARSLSDIAAMGGTPQF